MGGAPTVEAAPSGADVGLPGENEELLSLLECAICNELMHEPASLLCGHSFCGACLQLALVRSRACPLCRRPCHTASAIQTNIALASIARLVFPTLTAERALAASNAAAEPPRPKTYPLFLSTTVEFPGAPMRLHLFEPRYRELTRRALDSGDGEFGFIYGRGSGFPLMVDPASLRGVAACVVKIEESHQSNDGRWFLLARATRRARVLECTIEPGGLQLYSGQLRLYSDADEDEGREEADAVERQAASTAAEAPSTLAEAPSTPAETSVTAEAASTTAEAMLEGGAALPEGGAALPSSSPGPAPTREGGPRPEAGSDVMRARSLPDVVAELRGLMTACGIGLGEDDATALDAAASSATTATEPSTAADPASLPAASAATAPIATAAPPVDLSSLRQFSFRCATRTPLIKMHQVLPCAAVVAAVTPCPAVPARSERAAVVALRSCTHTRCVALASSLHSACGGLNPHYPAETMQVTKRTAPAPSPARRLALTLAAHSPSCQCARPSTTIVRGNSRLCSAAV